MLWCGTEWRSLPSRVARLVAWTAVLKLSARLCPECCITMHLGLGLEGREGDGPEGGPRRGHSRRSVASTKGPSTPSQSSDRLIVFVCGIGPVAASRAAIRSSATICGDAAKSRRRRARSHRASRRGGCRCPCHEPCRGLGGPDWLETEGGNGLAPCLPAACHRRTRRVELRTAGTSVSVSPVPSDKIQDHTATPEGASRKTSCTPCPLMTRVRAYFKILAGASCSPRQSGRAARRSRRHD